MRLFAIVLLLWPLPASAFIAQNGMTVRQIGPTEMSVEFHPRRGDTDYWCAAGDFAKRVLDQPGDTRLWRASPKPRRGGDGIVFTLDGAQKAEGAGLSHFGGGPRDGSVSIGMAVGNYCQIEFPFWRR
ncbi:hypothetical protein JJJ17_10325 [Paracoccus caeni]|uniref:Uncharacterized protein n=1 Tax=Paracoccus caeni TaxID=657651 RepID=A0A934SJL1_9RHOB|nr:hypothetical protein [Paracoccus caeni]MBK4216319.1 hypothetical protein [Paracoccus caeni]